MSSETKNQVENLFNDDQVISPYFGGQNDINNPQKLLHLSTSGLYQEIEMLKMHWDKLQKNNENLNKQAQKYKMLYEDKLNELKWYYRKYGRANQTEISSSIQTSRQSNADSRNNPVSTANWSRDASRTMLSSTNIKHSDGVFTTRVNNFDSNRSVKREKSSSIYAKSIKKTPK